MCTDYGTHGVTFLIVVPNLCISVPICELHECASSHVLHCGAKRALQITKYYVGVKSLNSTSLQSFVRESVQVTELQEHARPISMYGPNLYLWFSKKGDVYILWLFSASHQFLLPYQVSCI